MSSNLSVIVYCELLGSLGTVVPEKEDPLSRRVGRPKSEFKFVRHCVLCVIGVKIHYFF